MLNRFSRTELLFGKEKMDILKASRVAVFGIGGVGSYTAEALVRSGIGSIDIIDDDRVCFTNINRQLYATTETVGKYKTDAAEERIKQINPDITVNKHNMFYMPDTAEQLDLSVYDYIVDAIDTVTGKLTLIENAKAAGVPIISAMGAGNKTDPTAFEVADISKTSVCPLAKVMRNELKKRKIKHLTVVYSREIPLTPLEGPENTCKGNCVCPPGTKRSCSKRRQIPGSTSFVPPVVGMIIAGEVIKNLISFKGNGLGA